MLFVLRVALSEDDVCCVFVVLQAQSDLNNPEDKDGPRHVFSFSWLNQKWSPEDLHQSGPELQAAVVLTLDDLNLLSGNSLSSGPPQALVWDLSGTPQAPLWPPSAPPLGGSLDILHTEGFYSERSAVC